MCGEILIRKIVRLKRCVQEAKKIPNERDVGTLHEERKIIWKTKSTFTAKHSFTFSFV
jgi:hypothetical protein